MVNPFRLGRYRAGGWAVVLLAMLPLATASVVRAESSAPPVVAKDDRASGAVSADKLRRLLDLIGDPEVRALIEGRAGATPRDVAPPLHGPDTMAGSLGDDLQDLRDHLGALVSAAPRLPGELVTARSMLSAAVGERESLVWLFLVVFVGLGFGAESLFRLCARRWQASLMRLDLTNRSERIAAVFMRLGYGLGIVGSYALGSVGAFLLFDWSILLKQILLGYLLATLFTRLIYVFGRFFLAPGAERFRVAPIPTGAANFLFRRIGVLAVVGAFGNQTIALLGSFGFSALSRELSGYALGLLLLGIGFETIWRFPNVSMPLDPDDSISVKHVNLVRSRRFATKLTLTVALGLLGVLWVAQQHKAFWTVAFAVGLPATVWVTRKSIAHILRRSETPLQPGGHDLEIIFVERGVRSVLIIAAALLLGHLIGVDFVSLTMEDTLSTRIVRSILSVIIVVLLADLFWHAIGALIDRKLAHEVGIGSNADDAGHTARLQTLLPIMKNLLLAVLIVLTVMMVLAAIGIQIGPLIASAGVVGVAIGFGAQTLVKDIISGIFYLIDDAFRIGEYIQSGTYKGTVESFSLRSVKLRHQRGALYTVPFGILGAVQNQSRDWVVDKITLNVPYDTDLEKVRKIVKRIGETLAEDDELGPEIIKPIKMQGVAQFGEYAIQIQTKMMTKPGDVQFAARRRALLMIKQAFERDGIDFALPMVHVAGGDSGTSAAAQRGLSLLKGGKVDEAV